MDNLTFILGGARSGKSSYAERLATEMNTAVLYCATAEVLDEEMAERVKQHRLRRPADWQTAEAPRNAASVLAPIVESAHPGCVLMDCFSMLTSNFLLRMPEGSTEAEIFEGLTREEIAPLFALIERTPQTRWIIISNEVGMGVVPAYALGRQYRDLLGRANQCLAKNASDFYFLLAGVPITVKDGAA